MKAVLKTNFLFVLHAAAFLLCSDCFALQSQSKIPRRATSKTAEEHVTRNVVAEFDKPDEQGVYHATVSLGKVPVGKQASVNLLLKNLSDQEIKFSRPAKKCKCSQFNSERYFIPAKDETKSDLKLKLPARSRAKIASTEVVLESRADDTSSVKILFQYELEGMIVFGQPLSVLVFDDDSEFKTIEIPVVATSPIEFSKVEAKAIGGLKGVQIDRVPGPDGGVLKVKVNQNVLTGGNANGEIHITDPASGRMDICYLSVKDRRQSEVSPRLIRFNRKDTELKAKAIVRTAKLVKAEDSEKPLEIKCSSAGGQLTVVSKKLGKSIARVELTVSSEMRDAFIKAAGSSGEAKLQWEISHGDSSTTLETLFVIDEH